MGPLDTNVHTESDGIGQQYSSPLVRALAALEKRTVGINKRVDAVAATCDSRHDASSRLQATQLNQTTLQLQCMRDILRGVGHGAVRAILEDTSANRCTDDSATTSVPTALNDLQKSVRTLETDIRTSSTVVAAAAARAAADAVQRYAPWAAVGDSGRMVPPTRSPLDHYLDGVRAPTERNTTEAGNAPVEDDGVTAEKLMDGESDGNAIWGGGSRGSFLRRPADMEDAHSVLDRLQASRQLVDALYHTRGDNFDSELPWFTVHNRDCRRVCVTALIQEVCAHVSLTTVSRRDNNLVDSVWVSLQRCL